MRFPDELFPPVDTPLGFWIAFNGAVIALLLVDLFVFNREAREVSARHAAAASAVWVALSLAFCAFVWHWKGSAKGVEFLTGYLIEYTLSVDNIFVFVLLFSHFRVPPEYQHRVLFWGVLGALVMRGLMIAIGVALVSRFHWVLYLFGAFLLFTGIKMLATREEHAIDLERNRLLVLLRRVLPVSPAYEGRKFLTRMNGRLALTPLAVVLVMVEATDLVFAVDSIPAIFGVTEDPFIIYTSNVCAILGLRSLYFLLARVVRQFVHLKTGLALVLAFIGCKMLFSGVVHIPIFVSLAVVALILAASLAASLLAARVSPPPPPCS